MNKLIKDIRKAPELSGVEVVEVNPDGIRLYFKPGTKRTGKELLKMQDLLFKYKIYNFIKIEKAALYKNEIKEIAITIY